MLKKNFHLLFGILFNTLFVLMICGYNLSADEKVMGLFFIPYILLILFNAFMWLDLNSKNNDANKVYMIAIVILILLSIPLSLLLS